MPAPHNTNTWENLIEEGYSAYLRRDFYDAELLYQMALMQAVQADMSAHASVAKLLFLIADLFSDKHDYPKAEMFYRMALGTYEKIPGIDDIESCIALKRISEMCRVQGKYKEAANSKQRAEQLSSQKRKQLNKLFRRRIELPL